MFFLLSGEGVTDLGIGTTIEAVCEGEEFIVGPMAIIVEQIVETRYNYSIFDGTCG